MSRHSAITCSQAEDLMVRRTYESLPASDAALLRAHLSACDMCCAYAATMHDMQQTLSTEAMALPVPDPSIKCLLDARLLALQPVAVSGWCSRFFDEVRSLLRPAPGYQLAGAVALALFMVFIANRAPFQMDRLQELPAITADSMESTFSPDSTPDSLHHLENIRHTTDDSILILIAGQSI